MYLYIFAQFYRVYVAAVTGVAVDLWSGLVWSEAMKHQSRTAAVAAGEAISGTGQDLRSGTVGPVRYGLVCGISRCHRPDQTFMTTLNNQHQTANNVT